MHVRKIQANDGLLLKQLTLRSVEDAPHAFGGIQTLQEEQQRPDSDWHQLAAECAGDIEEWRDRCIGYILMDDHASCGKALVTLSRNTPPHAYMSAVWIDPIRRRRGGGRLLVQEACRWAKSKNADRLRLWVDDRNPEGRAFYQSLDFLPLNIHRPVSPGLADLESAFEFTFNVTE